jgi:hypothetical protein
MIESIKKSTKLCQCPHKRIREKMAALKKGLASQQC